MYLVYTISMINKENETMFNVTKLWKDGPRKGCQTIEKSIEKPRVGSVRTGAWNAKYKVIKVEAIS